MSVLYVGDWSVWDCGTCGYTMTSREARTNPDPRCRLCMADELLAELNRAIGVLRRERDELYLRATTAERQVSEGLDAIFELRAIVERAHCPATEPELPDEEGAT